MNDITKKLKTFSITALLICFTGVSQTANATIGLPDDPLFLGSSVQPNIFFGIDDSGSMAFGFLVEGVDSGRFDLGGNTQYRIPYPINQVSGHADDRLPSEEFLTRVAATTIGTLYTAARRAQATADLLEIWRAWTFAHNAMFYNPATTYIPWPSGEDIDGNSYTDAPENAARIDPYKPADGTVDLTTNYADYTTDWDGVDWDNGGSGANAELDIDGYHPAMYYAWNDTNATTPANAGNGVVNIDDDHTKVEIKPATTTYSTDGGLTDRSTRSDCTAGACTYAQEIQNFANWFSYYRTREYVMKRAISDLINDSSSYMGLATLHDNDTVGTAITDMTDAATSGTPPRTTKETLLNELFQIDSTGGTPLPLLLRNIGRYFDDTNSSSHSALGFTDSSPILSAAQGGECQQNFAVLLTDGFWNGTPPDVDDSNDNADGDDSTTFDEDPHADTYSDTLADQAMHYFERDLSTLANNVKEVEYIDPSNGLTYTDDNPQQHLTTYGVSFGLAGTGLATPADHNSGTAAPPWTDPINNTNEERLDDLQHAAFNGRGLFLNASDPEELIDSLSDALADIDQRTSVSGSAIAINSTVLKTTSRIFQASFNSVDWTGELAAFSLNADGTINTEVWAASSNLPTTATPDNREIFTSVSTGGIEFDDNPANAALETAIGTLTVGATTYTAAQLIQYISGVQTNEGTGANALRVRTEILGDIVSSSPISIGDQDLGYDTLPGFPAAVGDVIGQEGTSYGTFLAAKDATFTDGSGDPQTAVYVGANDGMFHAFHDSQSSSSDGNELFAYIPGSQLGKLKELADPSYGHKFFVNGNHSVGDACIDNGSTCTWKSILVGTLGEGGRTVFALDVTNPFTFTASDVLWEYNFDDTRTGTANSGGLGFTKGAPQVVRLNNGEWGVVFANGYNSDTHEAQLFILDAEDGTEIAVINTNVGDATNENGMAPPLIIDEDGDRIADTVYAGDLFGNMFKFDISDNSESNWETVWEATGPQPRDAEPLYQAKDAGGIPQAITTRPAIVVNPESGFNIVFGTGKYIETSDTTVLTPYQVETMYSIWDVNTNLNSAQVGDRTDLQPQTITEEVPVTVNGETFTTRIVSTNTIDYSTTNLKGWYMDALKPTLNSTTANGERIIADPLARFGRAIFTTFIPPASACDSGGTSVLMEIDALSGARLEDSVFDINGDGIIDDQDFVTLGDGTKVPVSGIYIPGTLTSPAVISLGDPDQEAKQLSGIDSQTTTVLESTGGVTVGRQSWRQLR